MPIPEEKAGPPSKSDISRGFDRLVEEGKIYGAELNPSIIKKSGGIAPFLVSGTPSRRTLLSRWKELFRNRIAPDRFLDAVSGKIEGFEHGELLLLFGPDRVIYDTQIFHDGVPAGNLTLFFQAVRDPRAGWAEYLAGRRLRIVYIEQIRLRERSFGYASALFRHYEKLFRELGFHQFRLKASLSVGKYYWAKEGFDCLEKRDLGRMKEELHALVRSLRLPVGASEIDRLGHPYDIAMFRRDVKVPVYRSAEGYYSAAREGAHQEEGLLPLGKAFLLCGPPWDGCKVIYTDTPRRTGFVHSEGFLSHAVRRGHKETGDRLAWLMKGVRREELYRSLVFLDPYIPGMEHIHRIHRPAHIEAFRRCVEEGGAFFSTRDCSISRGSFDAALLAAGGVMAGIDAVMNGRVENAFCAVRPPGHHAGKGSAMGFCFINNIAVGASYAMAAYGLRRVFILDFDVHHGNGTQEIFEDDPSVFFCSLHEHPSFCFPGTGWRTETGKGEGEGYTMNLPLPPGAGDLELAEVFDTEVVRAIEDFRPELILVSAGFDAHAADPIADLEWTEASYARMTDRLCELAGKLCRGRIVSALEGGYDPSALPSCVTTHLRSLQGRS